MCMHVQLMHTPLPELHAELQIAVGVGEGGEGDVRVAAELGRRYKLVCNENNTIFICPMF